MPIELPDDRIPNWPKSPEPVCPDCGDEGMIVVALRNPEPSYAPSKERGKMVLIQPNTSSKYEEMGPCPRCVIGFRVEFGIGVKKNSREEILDAWWVNPRGGPWGRDGYWRGRPYP